MIGAHHVLFKDRLHAGDLLAEKLAAYKDTQALILGLSRGGVMIATRVASILKLPVDVLVIKKLGSPYNREFAVGAVAPDNVSIIHWKDAHRLGLDEDYIQHEVSRLSKEIHTRLIQYRRGKKPIEAAGLSVIIIDDGAATGTTMEVAVRWVRKKHAKEIIVALPVASSEAVALLEPETDSLIVHTKAEALGSVGEFYTSFEQVSDGEVVRLLHEAES